jgi:glycosyltransferase involved in cell wall biosynthesis
VSLDSKFAPISVVIPCYLASSFLERAVNSVLSQSLMPVELILIDDASPDDGKTSDLIASLAKKIENENLGVLVTPIYLNENTGPGGARNAGWDSATQPWIAFLDADDAWDPEKIALQYQCISAHPSVDLLAHRCSFQKNDGNRPSNTFNSAVVAPKRVTLIEMLCSNVIATRSVMLRRDIPFRFPEKTLSEDYSLWLRILAAHYDVRLMRESLAFTFRPEYSEGGSSARLWKQEKGELSALKSLYRSRDIHFFIFLLAYSWSLLKYVRRFIIRTLHL